MKCGCRKAALAAAKDGSTVRDLDDNTRQAEFPLHTRMWDDSSRVRTQAAGLARGELHVWLVPVADACLGDSPLSVDERARAAKFRSDAARRQFVAGRTALRQVLGACLGADPAALRFGAEAHGKLFLTTTPAGGADVRFNLSHAGEWVAVVLARGCEVGIDVESVRALADWQPLVDRIFSPAERQTILSLPEEAARREAFFRGWTRKEACLKAIGEGLRDDLDAIEVSLAPHDPPRVLRWPDPAFAPSRWRLRDFPVAPDVLGAVACLLPERPGRAAS